LIKKIEIFLEIKTLFPILKELEDRKWMKKDNTAYYIS